jgi:CheY-like chemotaxis protein
MDRAPPRFDVLIVDDQPEVRRTVARLLTRQDASVLVASTGEQAVELAGTCAFRAVLTDFELPGLRGAELVRALRGAQPDARIVMMTGSELGDHDLQALREAGVDAFLQKPFGNDDLRGILRREG